MIIATLVTLMKATAVFSLAFVLIYVGCYLIWSTNDYLKSHRYSLYASYVLGILIFFVPLISQNTTGGNFSWGFVSDTIKAFSFVGVLLYGTIGYLIGHCLIKIARYAYLQNTDSTLKLSLGFQVAKKEPLFVVRFQFYLPPRWSQNLQFLVVCLSSISVLLIFYLALGDSNTSRSALILTLGIFIRILVQMLRVQRSTLVEIFELYPEPSIQPSNSADQ